MRERIASAVLCVLIAAVAVVAWTLFTSSSAAPPVQLPTPTPNTNPEP